jgi:S1-C subfamily serine protease
VISSALIYSALLFNLTLISASELKRQVEPSVFKLIVTLSDGQESAGTGFLISDTGHMVTNNHVIDGASKIIAENNGQIRIPVKRGFYARNEDHDLAIIQLDLNQAPGGFIARPLQLANDTKAMGGGEEIYVLGHPGGEKIAEFTIGSITAVEQEPRKLRFDASIHRGSSGSPMFNAMNGEVIGVVYSFWTGAAKLNYATPVEYLHEMLAKLDVDPILLPFRTPAKSSKRFGSGSGSSSGLPINLIISVAFFAAVYFGIRRILRAA